MDNQEIKAQLSPLQYHVTRENGTEPPFENEYWNNREAGIYVDLISGEPLFSSLDKFDSECGWPSFSRPLADELVERKKDESHNMIRTEIRSRSSDSHLGHLFPDGPLPSGLRYCINSAALRFIPLREMEARGYGKHLPLFKDYLAQKGVRATFAAGCFWGVEAYFRRVPGVLDVKAGYSGGSMANPGYGDVMTGETGHAEAVEIVFDPAMISYRDLLRHFWRIHDPTSLNRQGNDSGSQYRSAIFFHSEEQRRDALESMQKLASGLSRPVVTEIKKAGPFFPAEEYHQLYLAKNPGGYCHINLSMAETPLAQED
jgi:peptide methionine sulfoxide reductase msrA/msrB